MMYFMNLNTYREREGGKERNTNQMEVGKGRRGIQIKGRKRRGIQIKGWKGKEGEEYKLKGGRGEEYKY